MAEPQSTNYISREELSKHNKPQDLWISIHGKVYNVTNWLQYHPGGASPLLNLAGQDVTDAFLAFHPNHAFSRLQPFFTGSYLANHNVSEASRDYRNLLSTFTRMGLFDHNRGVLASLLFIFIMFCLCVYAVLFAQTGLVRVASGALMGFLWIQSGWIGHDSGHYKIVSSKKLNRVLQILSGNVLAGISIGWWKWNHNAHHIAVNSLDFDPDLQHLPFFVVSSRFFNSLFSCFYERIMKFDSFSRLLGTEILGLIAFWIWYPCLVSCLPNWGERILFVLASFSVTGIQHIQFCLNHFSAKVYVGPPTATDWCEKQCNGTLDVSCSSWMDWFHGGLQFQVEHHLFPRLPRCHLRKISPFVKDLCKKHNLPYNCVSFWKANALTIRTLRDAALQARDVTNPVPKNLVWEAVNTHG
ncbi:hypothetical protein AAHE18_16G257400 [Arachis hypogaea]